jgi:hypothetical protein
VRARTVAALLAGIALLIAPCGLASTSPAPRLVQLVLRPAQVGPGYRLVVRSDSVCLTACATLDLCGSRFASEGLRIARLQVNYVRPGRAVALSNEVVRYRPGGARQALAEVRRAVDQCPTTPVGSGLKGVPPLTYRPAPLRARHLLPGSLAFRLRVSGGTGAARVDQTVVVVYQARGEVLSGVYSYATPGVALADQIRVGLHAAAASARNLVRG